MKWPIESNHIIVACSSGSVLAFGSVTGHLEEESLALNGTEHEVWPLDGNPL